MNSLRPRVSGIARFASIALTLLAFTACADDGPTAPGGSVMARAASSHAGSVVAGGVYTSTNGATGNAVVAYSRASDGSLTSIGSFATGGSGIGGAVDPLISQYAVILGAKNEYLYVVNAGSNDITVFRVNADATLTWAQQIGSGGVRPVSLALAKDRLYVVNQGDVSVATFAVGSDGMLTSVTGGTRTFGHGTLGPTAARVSSDRRTLVVADGAAKEIDVFPLDQAGRPGAPTMVASSGINPFGFDITAGGVVVISEAGSGAVSSYKLFGANGLQLVDGSVSTQGAAPCWVRISPDGRYAYTTNAGSSTVSGFSVKGSGSISPLSANGKTGVLASGSTPLDLDITWDGAYLYTLNAGSGAIGAFMIEQNGLLTPLAGAAGAVTPRGGAQGLASW
jgi:6-phosphogluconolactonase